MEKLKKYKNDFLLTLIIIITASVAFITIRKYIIAGDLTLNPIALILFAVLNYFLGVFIHELGHLVFGLISGYTFISFRIGSFVVYKEADTLKTGTYQVPGSPAHCVLNPPTMKDGYYPSFFYHAGGFVLNLIVMLIALLLLNNNVGKNPLAFSFLISLLLMNLLVVLTNGIPFKMNGIPNDGYNLLNMHKDGDSYLALYLTMKATAYLAEGNPVKDLPNDKFSKLDEMDLSKHYVASAAIYYYEAALANEKYDDAYNTLIRLEPYLDKYDEITAHRIKKELSFCRILKDDHENFVDYLSQEDIDKDLKTGKNSITNQRVLFTKEFIEHKNFDKALKHKQKANELAKVHPLKNEAEFELKLIEDVEKNY